MNLITHFNLATNHAASDNAICITTYQYFCLPPTLDERICKRQTNLHLKPSYSKLAHR